MANHRQIRTTRIWALAELLCGRTETEGREEGAGVCEGTWERGGLKAGAGWCSVYPSSCPACNGVVL